LVSAALGVARPDSDAGTGTVAAIGGATTGRLDVAGAEGAGASVAGPVPGAAVAPGADGGAEPGGENEPGLSSDAVGFVPAGSKSQVTAAALTTTTAPATHQSQSRRRIGGRAATGWRWIVASVGTFGARCRFCSAFLRASRI
jgi:hypothetical protein